VPGICREARSPKSALQRRLWGCRRQGAAVQPSQSAPRLYVESLNEMIDVNHACVRVEQPRAPAILFVEVIGAAVASA
jgi:hypothetical protein